MLITSTIFVEFYFALLLIGIYAKPLIANTARLIVPLKKLFTVH